jgi:U3-containing 90S pre-ribosomal complex subunit
MVDEENISEYQPGKSIVEVVTEMINQMQKDGTHGDSLGVPQIMVLTPDTQVVVDVVKDLKAKFAEKKDSEGGVQVKIQKLFSKHISIEEHQRWLTSRNPGQYINVFVGVPNRIKKLIELGTIKVSNKKFKQIIIDSHLNPKNFSIFDIFETRDDLYDLFLLS